MDSKNATNLLSTKTLVKFGLNRQPFMDKGSNRYAFEDSAISTQINVLINIIHGSDKIVMIKGENGIGKSSLLYKLAKTRHKGLTFGPIKATDKITIEGICKLALKQLEIQPPSSNASIPEFFAKRVAFRRRTEGKTVLLIDDADQLDSYTIDQLLLLRKLVAEDGVPAISIVFAGHPQLEQILTALPRINNHLSILHTIYLYPFSEKQTADYVNQRIQFASNSNDIELLTPAQIQSIHNKAKGIPTLINYETCRVLEGMAGNKPKSSIDDLKKSESNNSGKLVPAVIISVAVISLAAIGYLIYGHIQLTSSIENEQAVATTTTMPAKKVTPFKPEQPSITAEAPSEIPSAIEDQDNSEDNKPEFTAIVPVAEPTTIANTKDNEENNNKTTAIQDESHQNTESAQATTTEKTITKEPLTKTEPAELTETPKENSEQRKISESVPPEKTTAKSPEQTPTQKDKQVAKIITEETATPEETKPKTIKTEEKTDPIVKQSSSIVAKQETKLESKPIATKTEQQRQTTQIELVKTKPAKAIPETKIKQRPKSDQPTQTVTAQTVTEWIKAQPPLNYTMQLLAAQDKASLVRYKEKNTSLKEAKIALTLRKGKEWYVLIIGSFKTIKDANNYLSKQPKPISDSKPWIRRFKPLQDTLK